ncbi:MAG: hypothetical protein ACLRK9_02495 [Roseburia hominis]
MSISSSAESRIGLAAPSIVWTTDGAYPHTETMGVMLLVSLAASLPQTTEKPREPRTAGICY